MLLKAILAGAGAAFFAWVGNRLALKLFGPLVIIFVVPFVEELSKTGLALLSGVSIIYTHGVFGLIEGVYDLFYTGKTGPAAAAASLAGHLVYGLITAWVYAGSGHVLFGVMAGYAVHMCWNLIVMRFLVRKKRRG